MKYMLDTNICIYLIKRKPVDVLERFKQTDISEISISSITLSELQYGVSKSSKPEQNILALTQFVAPLEILPYESDAAQYYGELRAFLEKQGTPIGSLDMLIAAHALSIRSTLVTNSTLHIIGYKKQTRQKGRFLRSDSDTLTVLELRSFFSPDPVARDKRSQHDQSYPPIQMPFPVQWRPRSFLSDLSP